MLHVKLFEQYIRDIYNLHESAHKSKNEFPMQILMRGNIGLTGKAEDFTVNMMKELYENYIRLVLIKGYDEYNHNSNTPNNRRVKIDYKYPILNMSGEIHEFITDSRANIFNQLEDYQISGKVVFHNAFKDADFVPKAVFFLNKIEQLKLPIIAKPSDGFSAKGIETFDTYEKARKSKLQFDLWSEAKDIVREFRAFILDGQIIHIAERIHSKTDNKAVGKKDPDEKINLIYIDQEIETFPYLQEIERINQELLKRLRLDFWNIDLMLDRNGKLWVPEINGAPGIGPSMFYSIYKNWVPFAYNGRQIYPEDHARLSEMAHTHRKEIKRCYPKEYKSSLNPIK